MTRPTVGHHLGFLENEMFNEPSLEYPAILKPNITLIRKPVVKLWPFLYSQDGRHPPSWIFEPQNCIIVDRLTQKTPS